MIVEVRTTNTGTSSNNQFTLPLDGSSAYNFNVDWGDSSNQDVTTNSPITHTYASSGDYDITIVENVVGGFPAIKFNNGGDCKKVINFKQWGANTWLSFTGAWYGCSNMVITATDEATAITGNVVIFYFAWAGCTSLTSFPLIDTSAGTSFSYAWYGCSGLTSFPLIDTRACTNFSYAWQNCSSLVYFPLINTSKGTNFWPAWQNCSSLVDFPLINTSKGANFGYAWYGCSSLNSFPELALLNGTNFTLWWDSTPIGTLSYTNILIYLAANNLNTTITLGAGTNKYYTYASAARSVLTTTRSWTITDGGSEILSKTGGPNIFTNNLEIFDYIHGIY